jgi:hypothetical protein
MFLPALLSSLLFAQLAPAIPATAPDPDYPIHVQLAQVGVTGGTYLSYYGRGNIIGDNPTGFDYASDCYRQLGPIQNRDPNAVYQARWKKQDQRLEILLQEIGSTHTSRCELKVTLEPTPYQLNTANPASSPPFIAATAPNPDYPLRVQLTVTRSSFSSSNGSHAEGRGNILDKPELGFDFSDSCDQRLSVHYDPNQFFQARWKKKDATLEILLQEVGSNKISFCDLVLTIQPHPYELSPFHRLPETQPPLSTSPTPALK